MKNTAFIPLRGGSVSIPLKNIKPLAGRPLAYWVLDAADLCKDIDTIVVSTDNEEIREIISKHPSQKIKIINRSAEVSTAEAPSVLALLEFAENDNSDNIVLIQATSPLITHQDITNGVNKLKEGYNSAVSVVRKHIFLWDEETSTPKNHCLDIRPRRQDWKGELVENGALYITNRNALLDSRQCLSGNVGVFEMSIETQYELDEPDDWNYLEWFLRNKNI